MMIHTPIIFMVLAASMAAEAAPGSYSGSGDDSATSAGSLPIMAIVFGLIGAAWLGVRSFAADLPWPEVCQAAFVGWVCGLLIGLPVSCLFR